MNFMIVPPVEREQCAVVRPVPFFFGVACFKFRRALRLKQLRLLSRASGLGRLQLAIALRD
jgi:hypothetical protein